jgi:hypothetical protein
MQELNSEHDEGCKNTEMNALKKVLVVPYLVQFPLHHHLVILISRLLLFTYYVPLSY